MAFKVSAAGQGKVTGSYWAPTIIFSFNTYNPLAQGTGSPILQRLKQRFRKVQSFAWGQTASLGQTRIWAWTYLIAKNMFFSAHCTAYLPTVTGSTLVRT